MTPATTSSAMDGKQNDIYDLFGLTGTQRQAAAERERDTAVTAGAGSGKTRTLVARYLALLSEGCTPSRVIAITFTDKAAREMRSRVRSALQTLAQRAESAEERRRWAALESSMDSARIGTIHGLCAEILRSHPAEAGMDPRFEVIEENQAAVLKTRAVADGLTWAISRPGMGPLLEAYQINGLENLLRQLLARRLDLTARSFDPSAFNAMLCHQMARFLQADPVAGLLDELRRARMDGTLSLLAGEKLADQVALLLESCAQARAAVDAGASLGAGQALFRARREYLSLRAGKIGRMKDAVKELQTAYDGELNLWLGGRKSDDAPPDEQAERLQSLALPLLEQVYRETERLYLLALEQRGSVDFDGLEGGALRLLRDPAVRTRWQAEAQAVLVDEFQDTNARQRELVEALCGPKPGRLFVVGDARQSIYRFRGADVTVFTDLQTRVAARGGLSLDLDTTFRAHPDLLEPAGFLLRGVMGDQPQPGRPYAIPYAALNPGRPALEAQRIRAPFVEVVLNVPDDTLDARTLAARAFARRLVELRQSGEISDWGDVALLFRASTTFPYYEEALEAARIPYVTVAGSGFYDRPEVRDMLNLLRVLANPWDDLALAGALRSPVFGVSDAGLYRLRIDPQGRPRGIYAALRGDLSMLDEEDRRQAQKAREMLAGLLPLAGRLPVADVLRQLVTRCDLHAVLAAGSGRLWRNVDKLISDAAASGLVQASAFLEYLDTLRESAARESEAVPEADGAVRLMTIHKSKGLEFPFVALADAARENHHPANGVCRLGECWTARLAGEESAPLAYRLAAYLEKDQDDAESLRLLYVALTRAQDKLLISGHVRLERGLPQARGWLDDLLAAGGADLNQIVANPGQWQVFSLNGDHNWAACAYPDGELPISQPVEAEAWPVGSEASLAVDVPYTAASPGEGEDERPVGFYATSILGAAPARVAAELACLALRRWQFPGDAGLERLLLARAHEAGLLDDSLAGEAARSAERLLARFQLHPLYREIQTAEECYHELPYQLEIRARVESGLIDCLYRGPGGWRMVEFHAEALRSLDEAVGQAVRGRDLLEQRSQALMAGLGGDVAWQIVFLDVDGQVLVRDG